MRRIVVIAASMAGINTATRIKRRLPDSETVLVIPAALEKTQSACKTGTATGPVARRLSAMLPDLVKLSTRRVGIVEAHDIMPDLENKQVSVTSPRGSVTLRYSDLILEAPATVRLPRAIQKANNFFCWPLPGFSAEPEAFDAALAAAASEAAPVVVVGRGICALDAVFVAREAGAAVHWVQTGEQEVADIDPLLLRHALNALGSDVSHSYLPETAPDGLSFLLGRDGSFLETLTLTDGTVLQSPCFIWSSPLMGRHPILREEGVSLDPLGRIFVEDGITHGLAIMGSGSAVPALHYPNTELLAPLYPGCADCADTSALLCVSAALGENPLPEAASMAIGIATKADICLMRAGYSMSEAGRAGIEAEYAVTSLPNTENGRPELVLSLICSKNNQNILGAQVLGMDDFASRAEGLFNLCVAAIAQGSTLDAILARHHAGTYTRLLAQGVSILKNKLQGMINGISPDELMASQEAGAEFFTLDLRPLQDWQNGHINKAYNIPLLQLKKRLQLEVPHFTPLVLISEDGTDAYAAACKLSALGASSLYILDGGMRLWPYALEKENG